MTELRSMLADRVALAIVEHGPLACERLARIVGRRTSDVRDALRRDSRFERAGGGRGSRWQLALDAPVETRDGLGRILSAGVRVTDESTVEARLEVIERRLDVLEKQLVGASTS